MPGRSGIARLPDQRVPVDLVRVALDREGDVGETAEPAQHAIGEDRMEGEVEEQVLRGEDERLAGCEAHRSSPAPEVLHRQALGVRRPDDVVVDLHGRRAVGEDVRDEVEVRRAVPLLRARN